ncbi:MAG: hypothetical protein JW893_05820, partial [Candidatus Omnitrophica bacterium]|nr:hypothetical protein [Candidatus Omnitrophota bacterium]
MNIKKILLISWAVLAVTGCSHSHYRFHDMAPVTQIQDTTPTDLPEKTDFDFVENAITSAVRFPLVGYLDPRKTPRSQDVNALDQVPASSWYTPRMGYQKLTPQEILDGPRQMGPPEKPYVITKAKTKGDSPGFIIQDKRGLKYLIKFDNPDYPSTESGINLIVNRLFWAFGYNVPEDYLVEIHPDDWKIGPESKVTETAIQDVLMRSAVESDGRYRATASLFLQGTVLGPIPPKGTRPGDPHDQIPHENLRILRALRVFSAFLDQSGMRADNSLDVYVGDIGEGHTQHYLLDFGEALGAHGLRKNRMWDGFEHFFSWEDFFKNALTFGYPLKPWEKMTVEKSDPRGSFESHFFQFNNWKETYQYLPMEKSLPDDDYWAAKIISSLSEEHLRNLFQAAHFPDPEYSQYLIETLLQRREKILASVFRRITPLESRGIEINQLKISDMEKILSGSDSERIYEVHFYNQKNKKIHESAILKSSGSSLSIPIPPIQ